MTTSEDPQTRIQAARNSFTGRTLTDSQFREAMAITEVIHAEIERSGSFIEKLNDYAHAFARTERFDALRGEKIVRDLYTESRGETMNQTREKLLAAEKALPHNAKDLALKSADLVCRTIQEGETKPFYLAFDTESGLLADILGSTQACAKTLMKDAFISQHGRDLYEAGKEIEAAYHKPVREAEIAARKAEKLPSYNRNQSMP